MNELSTASATLRY